MESVEKPTSNRCSGTNGKGEKEQSGSFQMPLHYPRYTRANYETMPEWKIDCLLKEYGLPVTGDLEEKRKYAMGAFLWSWHRSCWAKYKWSCNGVSGETNFKQMQWNKWKGRKGAEWELSDAAALPEIHPRYTRANYVTMPEWKIDFLLREYGLPVTGDLEQKRKYAMGAFLWSR
ncbi:hypothetical protein SADUNF_Sadunf03G0045400 [Salix dunnii]|uniref:DUF7722 domain-containing protein n=1 Tax=Salix dunnii TaxID=1413687 RepID=A0A835KH39_9ROSI|nr:hypothetical protein SADUNF_Sadunf03G0045400 [Salix dunnii]